MLAEHGPRCLALMIRQRNNCNYKISLMANKYIGQALSKSTEENIDFALMHMYCLIPIHFCIIIRKYDMQHLRLCKYSK